MNKLENLKIKYKNAYYEPAPDCEKCNGDGEYYFSGEYLFGYIPCMCIYINHNHITEVRQMFKEFAQKMRKELDVEVFK